MIIKTIEWTDIPYILRVMWMCLSGCLVLACIPHVVNKIYKLQEIAIAGKISSNTNSYGKDYSIRDKNTLRS